MTLKTGCLGFCEKGPRVVIYPEDIAYFKVQASDVPEIVSKTLLKKEIVERLLYVDPNTGEKAERLSDVPFYKYQYRLLMDNNAKVDPKKIEDYIALMVTKHCLKYCSSLLLTKSWKK